MSIDPCAGIGGAYVIDPKTGERVLADQAAPQPDPQPKPQPTPAKPAPDED